MICILPALRTPLLALRCLAPAHSQISCLARTCFPTFARSVS